MPKKKPGTEVTRLFEELNLSPNKLKNNITKAKADVKEMKS